MALAVLADKEGRCSPTVSEVAKDLDVDEKTVRAAVRDLEDAGAVVVDRRPGGAHRYTLTPERSGKNTRPTQVKTPGQEEFSLTAQPINGSAVAYIPLVNGSEFGVSAEFAAELEKLYPAVDVPQTLNDLRGWNLTNPSRRKTPRGIRAHINAWMAREQNKAR
jgi:DNA-binding transcriptional ArsR family regulator